MRSSLMSIAALGLASVVLAVPAPKHNIGDIHKHHFNGTKVSWVHPTTAGPRGTGACSDYSPEESEVPKKKKMPKNAHPSTTTTPYPSPSPTSSPPAISSPTPDTSGSKDAMEYVNLHKELRAKHHANPLAYDAGIAAKAQAYAETCSMVHSNTGPENLCMGYGSYTSCINAWYEEGEHINYNEPVYNHFTQVVWKSTKKIGCGYSKCDAEKHGFNSFIVCQYDEGNIADPEYFKKNVERE